MPTTLINSYRFAAPTAWVPSDEPGLGVWLKADALSLADGAPVVTWTDSSTNGASPTQADTTKQPTFRTNVINGKPVVRFAGLTRQDWLRRENSPALLWTAAEVFIVVKLNVDPPAALAQCGLWYWNSSTDSTLFPFTNGVIEDSFGTTARKTTVNPTPSLTSFRLYNVVSTASEWTNTLDGTQLFTTATNTVTMDSPSDAFVIGAIVGGTVRLDGDIAEVILYDHKLGTTARANLKSYISTKYGLTIA